MENVPGCRNRNRNRKRQRLKSPYQNRPHPINKKRAGLLRPVTPSRGARSSPDKFCETGFLGVKPLSLFGYFAGAKYLARQGPKPQSIRETGPAGLRALVELAADMVQLTPGLADQLVDNLFNGHDAVY